MVQVPPTVLSVFPCVCRMHGKFPRLPVKSVKSVADECGVCHCGLVLSCLVCLLALYTAVMVMSFEILYSKPPGCAGGGLVIGLVQQTPVGGNLVQGAKNG